MTNQSSRIGSRILEGTHRWEGLTFLDEMQFNWVEDLKMRHRSTRKTRKKYILTN